MLLARGNVPSENQKKRQKMDATVVCINQIKTAVHVEPRAVCVAHSYLSNYPDNAADVSFGRDSRGRQSLFSRFEEYVIANYEKRIILVL